MSRRGTLIFYASAYVSVRLCFRPPMFPSAYVSVRQRLCPPVSLPVCVYVRLYPCLSASLPVYVSVRLYPCQSASLPVSTLSTVAHQALFHRSLSNLSGFFCSSRLSCSFLFSLILSFHSSSSSFSLLLFFSDIFSSYSYSLDPSCSSRDTPFSVKKPVSRAYSAKLRRTPCRDTPF